MQVDESTTAGVEESIEVAAAATGDVEAFEALYRRHSRRVYALCLRMTGNVALAEDCMQDAFVAAWRALPGFQRRSGFGTWLHRIAVNAVLARRRSAAARLESSAADDELLAALLGGVEQAPALDVERAILALPEGARDVLVLVALHGHSHEEAAESLGIAVGTCKAQLHRARRLLSEKLELRGDTP